jgi:carbon-monoxide dehydrogenase small subunit
VELHIAFSLNGTRVEADVHPGSSLLDVLKHSFGMISVKRGCETGECGACTVLLDGKPINSCLVLAAKVQRRSVITLEGLAEDELAKRLQRRFIESNALQCGFCTPGILITLYALIQERPLCSEDEIKTAVEGNLCRCGAYLEITKAALEARHEVSKPQHAD